MSTTSVPSAKRPRAETIPGQGAPSASQNPSSQPVKHLKPGPVSFSDDEAAEAEDDPEANLDDTDPNNEPVIIPGLEDEAGAMTTEDEGPGGIEGITQTMRKARLSGAVKKQRFQERHGHLMPEEALGAYT